MAKQPSKSSSKNSSVENIQVEIQEIQTGIVRFNVLGDSPLIMHRYPFKAWMELVLPSKRENRAALEQTLKHVPIEEYRESTYCNRDEKRPALFHLPNGMFAGCIAQTGVDIPGASRAMLERLTRIIDVNIDLFGIPQIFCAMVRNSGMNRTPDVRTRAIFPQWACGVTVRYIKPQLTERNITNLMGAAGMINGIGDWRGEKGGPYGAFRIVSDSDPAFKSIIKNQTRKLQQAAFDAPAFHDEDTEKLLVWFNQELKRREQDGDETPRRRRGNGDLPKVKIHNVRGSRGEDYVGADASS